MKTLYDAGFDPMGTANFFQKLAAEYRYASKPPEMLLTHPLPETRISEARARAGAMVRAPRRRAWTSGWLGCIQVRYGTETPQALLTYFDSRLQKGITPSRMLPSMARRWPCCSSKRTDEADTLMQELATRHPRIFVVDALTDIDPPRGAAPRPSPDWSGFRTRMPTTRWWW